MEEGDRMVYSKAMLPDDLHGAARFMGCAEEDILEELIGDMVGAGAGE